MAKDSLPFWYEPLGKKDTSNHACNASFIIEQFRPANRLQNTQKYGRYSRSKWDGFQSTVLKKVGKVICESFAISYRREFEGRETEVSVKSGELENSKYKLSLLFHQNEENAGLDIINLTRNCGKVLTNLSTSP